MTAVCGMFSCSGSERSAGRGKRAALWAGAALTALLAGSLTGCAGKTVHDRLTLASCTAGGVAARCGTLRVAEDPTSGGGRTIPLRIDVIPAAGPDVKPDPIVFFAGGPGDSAVDMLARLRPLAGSQTHRDLVFIDQRGTGASNVSCPSFPGLNDEIALRASVTSCLHGLSADLRFYSTAAFADDVDRVLTDLHYKTANLVGISYGVTAEQVFLIRHPTRVRTMTMLSGTLLTVPVFEQMPRATQQALDAVFAECATGPACHAAFPNLPAEWASLWHEVQAKPWVVPADRAPDGEQHVFDADWFAGQMHQLLFVATTQADIPVVVHTLAVATDPVTSLLAIAAAMPPSPTVTPSPGPSSSPSTTAGSNQMLAFATQCSEPWAHRDPGRLVDTTSFEYHADLASAQLWQYECGLVPHVQQSYDAGKLADPNVAVLALNGTADPQDPPANMAAAQALWRDSAILQVPGQGHDIDNRSAACEIPIIQSFVDQGNAEHLDSGCLPGLAARMFATSLAAAAGR